jgi:tyrosyl-tRNA synthetase
MTLLLKNDGKKMGKTESGALWLDPDKTSPYDFYQYWRNVDDADVKNCLALLTFLPMDEVCRLGALEGSAINEAKKVLAFEVTRQIHGGEEAAKAQQAAEALFEGGGAGGSIPTTEITAGQLDESPQVIDMLMLAGLAKSRGDARRLITGGGFP